MSDSASTPPSPAPPPPAGESPKIPAAAQPKLPAKGKWRRRLRWTFLVLLVLAVLLRIALVIALPKVLQKVAAGYGLNCTYERLELSLTGGDVGLWHLKLTPRAGGEPYVHAEYVRGDISTLNLLRGRLAVYRVEADGVHLNIDRNADGSFPLLKCLAAGSASPTAAPVTPADAKPQDVDLTGPFTLDAFRMSHVRCRFRDYTASPTFEAELWATMRLSDMRSAVRPTRFELDVAVAPLLDSLHVEGEAKTAADTVDATLNVLMRGAHLKPAARYLAAAGLRPVADDVGLRMSARAQVTLKPATQPSAAKVSREIHASAQVQDIALRVDGRQMMSLGSAAVEARLLPGGAAVVKSMTIEHGRVLAERDAAGRMVMAGLAMVSPPPTTAPVAQPAPAAGQPVPAALPAKPAPLSIEQFTATDIEARWIDRAVSPESELALVADRIDVANLVSDPDRTDAIATLSARLRLPGMVEAVELSGSASPFAPRKVVDLALRAQGIRPEAVRPYMDALGLESHLASGSFSCKLHAEAQQSAGGLLADASLSELKFDDGQELFALDGVKVSGITVDSTANRIAVDDIAIDGPRLSANRRVTGALAGLGLQTKTPAARRVVVASEETTEAASAPQPQAAPAKPPKLEIGHVAWRNLKVHLEDQTTTPATTLAVGSAGLEISGLSIDPDPRSPSPKPGSLSFWLTAPGVVRALTMTGTIVPRPAGPSLDLDVRAEGLTAEALRPYLRMADLAPAMRDGSLRMKLHAGLDLADGGMKANMTVNDLRLDDAGTELLGVDAIRIVNADMSQQEMRVDAVHVERPRLYAQREADGALVFAGLRTIVPAPSSAPSKPTAAAADSAAPARSTGFSLPSTQDSLKAELRTGPTFSLKSLSVHEAQVHWADRAVARPVDTTANVDVTVNDLVLGRPAPPAKLSVTARGGDFLGNLTVSGQFSLAPAAPSAHIQLTAAGVRPGVLQAYLPPGISSGLGGGSFRATLDAGLAPHKQGGQTARLVLTDIDWREADAESAMFHVDSARVIASRLDAPGRVIAIDEIAMDGLDADAHKSADGAMHLMGLVLSATTPEPAQLPAAAHAPATAPMAAGAPATRAAAAEAAPAAPVRVALRAKPPLVTLDKLDLNLRRVRFTDQSRQGAAPLALSDVRLHNLKPVVLLGDEPEVRPPTELMLSGSVSPLAKSFVLTLQAAPFAAEPNARGELTVSGIRGDGLVEIAPDLRPTLDGSKMTDGRFHASFEAQAKLERRGPLEVDLSHGFDVEVFLKNIAFRSVENGPVLAGVDGIHLDGIHAVPATGLIHVKSIEISKPIGHVRRDAEGIWVLGWAIKAQPGDSAATRPAVAAAAGSAMATPVGTAGAASAAAVPAAAPAPSGEVRIDRILVSGLDVSYEDTVMSPPVRIPLSGLDMEVRDLSSRATVEDRPFRFSVAMSAGKVPLAKRQAASGVIGLIGDIGKAKPTTAPAIEDRELFSEIAVSGRISLYPQPKGWIKTSVSGLEFAALEGAAKQGGVTLGGGTFDTATDVRLAGDGAMDLRTRLVLTDLKLSEPSGGPIQRYFALKAPLDTVIGVLQSADGSITIPLNVPIRSGGVSTGTIIGESTKAFGAILATAIASAPVKVVSGVGSFIGIGGKGKAPPGEEHVVLAFEQGQSALDATSPQIQEMIERLRRNRKLHVALRHDAGAGDIERATLLANPSADDCARLARQFHQRKIDLLQSRAQIASAARAQLAAGADQQAGLTLARVRAIDLELARTEDALDQLYDMLRPGAARQADRRTRVACLEMGQARLSAVEAVLLRSDIADIASRVRSARPQFGEPTSMAGGTITAVLSEQKAP